MSEYWLGYTTPEKRKIVAQALHSYAAHSTLEFCMSAAELRKELAVRGHKQCAAVVGLSSEGISDINLAAALVQDGHAAEVVLVCQAASGSLKSRAVQAHINQLIDLSEIHPASKYQQPSTAKGDVMANRLGAGERRGLSLVIPQINANEQLQKGRSRAPIISFVSGRGGVGKTTLVASCAALCSSWHMSCALVDLDLSCGNLSSCFSMVRPSDLSRMSSQGAPSVESMGRMGVRCTESAYLWGPCERPETAELAMPYISQLIQYLAQCYEIVLIDTSTTFTDAVAQAVQQSDRIFMVHDGAGGSTASLTRTVSLMMRLGVARTRIVQIDNLTSTHDRPWQARELDKQALAAGSSFIVRDGGIDVSELLSAGQAMELIEGKGYFVSSLTHMLVETLSELGYRPSVLANKSEDTSRPKQRHFSLFRRKEIC